MGRGEVRMKERKIYWYAVTYDKRISGLVTHHSMKVQAATAKDAVRTVQFEVRQLDGKWSAYHCVAKRIKEEKHE